MAMPTDRMSDVEQFVSREVADGETISDDIAVDLIGRAAGEDDLRLIWCIVNRPSRVERELSYRLNFGPWMAEVEDGQFDHKFRFSRYFTNRG